MSAFDPQGVEGDGTGKVKVVAAGTPQPITASGFIVKAFTVQSDPANAGTYFYVKDMNGYIMGKIQKGQSFTPPQLPAAGVDLSRIQIDADTTGDGCYVSYV